MCNSHMGKLFPFQVARRKSQLGAKMSFTALLHLPGTPCKEDVVPSSDLNSSSWLELNTLFWYLVFVFSPDDGLYMYGK